jgi:DNA-binding transcriptional regulator PaaX
VSHIEARGRKRAAKRNLKKVVLSTIAAAGLLGVGLLAPNVIGALGKFGMIPTRYDAGNIERARRRLIAEGLLVYEGKLLRLTKRGEIELRRIQLSSLSPLKSRKWDGRWRVLIFDIPERQKNIRNRIRQSLVALGFLKLQHSVWAFPYDCEEIITLLKADLKVGKNLLYMIVDELECDAPLRKHFGVS